MPKTAGPRIRARRLERGIAQARLAGQVGISPSYLNLIEHGRRRIGGKLLADIARALGTGTADLAEGRAAAVTDTLRRAAGADAAVSDLDRSAEFADAFPGWAGLVARQHERIGALERTVERLGDRLSHDPLISASVHEVLSKVTAIRSSAGILAEGGELAPEWQARFHRNIDEDSRTLARIARDLAAYLGAPGSASLRALTPHEERERWLAARDFHLPQIEAGEPVETGDLDGPARGLLDAHLARARADAERLPLASLKDALGRIGLDPFALAQDLGVGLALLLRRLASCPAGAIGGPVGIVLSDGAGALTFRRPVEGFEMPRYGAACPLWPLYQALQMPAPVACVVEQADRAARPVAVWATAERRQPLGLAGPVCVETTMLVVPSDLVPAPPPRSAVRMGPHCRICEIADCPARRQPSILSG